MGRNHPNTATSLNNLAELYETQQRYGDAERLYVQSLDIRSSLLGDNHPATMQTLRNLTRLRNRSRAANSSTTAGMIATLVFQSFLEKAGEKFTEAAIIKMNDLSKRVWAKLRGNLGVEKMKEIVEQGAEITQEQVKQLVAYLQTAIDDDPQFSMEVQMIAQEIMAMQNDSSMTQINYGGTNYQVKTGADNTNFFGGTHHYGQR